MDLLSTWRMFYIYCWRCSKEFIPSETVVGKCQRSINHPSHRLGNGTDFLMIFPLFLLNFAPSSVLFKTLSRSEYSINLWVAASHSKSLSGSRAEHVTNTRIYENFVPSNQEKKMFKGGQQLAWVDGWVCQK